LLPLQSTGVFPGGKGCRFVRLNLPSSCAVVMKSGNLNFLEPSGPLRCATSRTVPGSFLGGVTGIFSDIFSSDRTMVLGSTQPLVKMSIRNIPWGKDGRCVRLTTSSPSYAECHGIWESKPPGTLWTTPGLLRDCITFYILKGLLVFQTTMPTKRSKFSSCEGNW